LENAFAQADKLEAEEQAIIVKKVEEMAQHESVATRQRQYMMMVIAGLVFLMLIGYMLWRRSISHKHKQKHLDLKKAYGELEEATSTKEREMTTQRIAQDIRQSMQPVKLPQLKGISLYTSQTPGLMPGNDLCETIVRDNQLFFCVGNALGEGVQAAVTMAMVGAQFRSLTAFESAPERIVEAVNEVLADVQRRMTLFVGVLDLATGRLVYCNAGHNVPLLMNTEVNLLPVNPCQPVGEQADCVYSSQEVALDKGSMLFLYTDGMKTAENANQKMFGEKAVRGAALQALKLNPEPKAFIGQMLDAVKGFTSGTPQKNDITLLVIGRR
jgi:sigma-B regulation protein RsbU (phosphoserine phosphatase)